MQSDLWSIGVNLSKGTPVRIPHSTRRGRVAGGTRSWQSYDFQNSQLPMAASSGFADVGGLG